MKNIDRIRQELGALIDQCQVLTDCLMQYERQINKLVATKTPLKDMSIAEKIHLANLLISLFEDEDD